MLDPIIGLSHNRQLLDRVDCIRYCSVRTIAFHMAMKNKKTNTRTNTKTNANKDTKTNTKTQEVPRKMLDIVDCIQYCSVRIIAVIWR